MSEGYCTQSVMYKAVVNIDDMVDAALYGINMETAGRLTHGVITSMKEVKNKMYLQLMEVIFFNRKDRTVAFRLEVVVEESTDAFLLAAQAYGKYDPKVHAKAVHTIAGFNTDVKEN